MLNYKGYEIPETFEEIFNKPVNIIAITPYYNGLIFNLKKGMEEGIKICIPISLEELQAAKGNKEKEDQIANMYIEAVKAFILQSERN